jgi:hypothetical protein
VDRRRKSLSDMNIGAVSRWAQMEDRIADERNFSAVLEASRNAIRWLVRKRFANLGKPLLTVELLTSTRTSDGVCACYTI